MIGLEPGTLFGGRYQIIRSLGAGGMGAVYLARDPRHPDFKVAVKILYPGIIKTPEARERFRNEIVASYRVNHPNIVRAYEYFDEADSQAYAMEFVDGGDLQSRMQSGKLPLKDAISIIRQTAAGLEAVHAEGIIHRDLKPENILLTSRGIVKISDFGVARLRGSASLTQAGAMVGTPKYLSPEYVETGECDHRGDIFALGVIAYELICGISPYLSVSQVSLMVERLESKVRPLNEIAPDCPKELAYIIGRAMQVRLSGRYQRIADLRNDLELFEAGRLDEISQANGSGSDHANQVAHKNKSTPNLGHRPVSLPLNLLQFCRNHLSRLGAVAAVCGLVLALGWYQLNRNSHSLSALPHGTYTGSVFGLMADDIRLPFQVWRTEAGTFALLGLEYCSVNKVDSGNQFSCGDLVFQVGIETLEKTHAVGRITEQSWGTVGTWNLIEVKE